MKIRNRFLALAALLGASTLALSGCVIPFGGDDDQPNDDQNTTQNDDSQNDDSQSDDSQDDGPDASSFDLADTEWSGTIDGSDVELLFNSDGTIDFIDYGGQGSIDHPNDTWSVNGTEVTMSLAFEDGSGNETIIDLTGELNPESLELSGGGMSASLTIM
ncbi:hypothetical protein [uncultured Agrococcus sp.]|uniref:hypothetical protein n=1 Tax=uncultured Agrococcus sp. TaxID=382258 RepID=UPI0025E6F44A|nr:hypothetical protein [uncultured Agrococcus sp.]